MSDPNYPDQGPEYGQHTTPYGEPLYPGPEYGQPGQQYGPPPYPGMPQTGTGGGGRRDLLIIGLVVAVLAALALGAVLLVSAVSGDSTSSSAASRPRIPAVTIPPVINPPNNLPTTGLTNPCAYLSDPQTVAVAYVGAAEIGQTDIAQACVFQHSVPRSMTASLAATSGQLFVPSGSTGSTFRFASIDGRTQLAVTVTKENDGKYYITNVVRS